MGQGLAQSGQVISPITIYGPRDRVTLYKEYMGEEGVEFVLWLCRGSSRKEVRKLVVPGLDRHLVSIHCTCSDCLKLHKKVPHDSEVYRNHLLMSLIL